jgi:hypothetical protein
MLEPWIPELSTNNEDDASASGPSQTNNSSELDQLHHADFQAPAGPSNAADPYPTKPRNTGKARVTVHTSCVKNLKLRAMAMWGTYDQVTHYYIDF